MRGFLRELAVDAAEAGKRTALDPSTSGTLEEEIDRLVSVTAIAIERTEMRWAEHIAPDVLADAIDVAGSYDHESFRQAVDDLILFARVAMGEIGVSK